MKPQPTKTRSCSSPSSADCWREIVRPVDRPRVPSLETLEDRLVPTGYPYVTPDIFQMEANQTLNLAALQGVLANDSVPSGASGETLTVRTGHLQVCSVESQPGEVQMPWLKSTSTTVRLCWSLKTAFNNFRISFGGEWYYITGLMAQWVRTGWSVLVLRTIFSALAGVVDSGPTASIWLRKTGTRSGSALNLTWEVLLMRLRWSAIAVHPCSMSWSTISLRPTG